MRFQNLLTRGFLLCLLYLLISACSQHPTTTKDKVAVEPPHKKIQPEATEPEVPEPEVPEPEVPEPEVPEPEVPEPEVPEPEVPEPEVPEPEVPEPEVPEHEVPEPEAIEPEAVETERIKPSQSLQVSITGQIELNQNQIRRENAQVDKTVIYFQPDDISDIKLKPESHEIITENKRFAPDVLAITNGSTVQFPVKDPILHNVFSVTPGNNFDLGLYSEGTTKSHTFNQTGIVYVHCNVHHAMQADIIVLNTPYFTYADDSGQYILTDLPNVSGTLHFWHPRGQQLSVDIEQPSTIDTLDKTLIITRPKVPKHTNKFGKSYRPTRN
ncbi:cupredoxin domain-containing protein [Marinicella gelatinilytica]|uniref:cupredoxin domain-containing protein n=1 Tax=Marinicella gelatinilytica TaxID=2996017 RepID=UPI002260C206|nr:hypothetical protein [Marinicella gelatinilytica]MCX7544773.1 hypothetical protein [Marinicella gelatinilytica]